MPGEKISEYAMPSESTIVENKKTYASVVGFMDETNKFIPISGVYRPKIGDSVLGVIIYARSNGYKCDINYPFEAFLSARDTRTRFKIGEIFFGKIKYVDEVGNVDITNAHRLAPGKLISFPAVKIPRLIGKKNTMLSTIMRGTGTEIEVGNNGYVWLKGGNIPLALKAIDVIDTQSHISGLTQQITDFLKQDR